jgi:hypothetical protein
MSIAKRVLNHFSIKDGVVFLSSPHKFLGGISPNQALANGEFLRVNDLLDQMDAEKKKRMQ